MLKKAFLTLVTITALASSGHAQSKETTVKDPDNLASQYFSQVMGIASEASQNVKLYKFIYEWLGTPYRFGGNTNHGIDCSAFTKALYDKVFNTSILRNSRDIFRTVEPLTKSELKQGDLVFFKNNSTQINHVGIYLGDNKFAHASSSRGVVISNLNEPYYSRNFYRGGRLPEKDANRFVIE